MEEFLIMWGILIGSTVGALLVIAFLCLIASLITEKFGEIGFLIFLFAIATGIMAWILTGEI